MRNRPNVFLYGTKNSIAYTSPRSLYASVHIPERDRKSHAEYIRKQFMTCMKKLNSQQVAAIRYKQGTYMEFFGAKNCDLITKSIENRAEGIRILNVKASQNGKESIIRATVYIPQGKEKSFLQKIEKYAKENTKKERPKYNDLMRSIENISLAVVDSFWIGKKTNMPTSSRAVWCEIWLRYNKTAKEDNHEQVHKDFLKCCESLSITSKEKYIIFPERIVEIVHANIEQLQGLVNSCDNLAEFRRAPDISTFFADLFPNEQIEWIDDMKERVTLSDTHDVTVCLLDTGLSDKHPLLVNSVQNNGVHAVESTWGTNDHEGHGTEMAGVALYNDLQTCLSNNNSINLRHNIESVKILPPNGSNPPELYGAITEQAVALAEIANPKCNRVICMAVTARDDISEDGRPSSWSGTLDKITSGADGNGDRRLFIVSSGNVEPQELNVQQKYIDANIIHGVENPGQSWNSLTVGAYTNQIYLSDRNINPVADVGELSPYSSTSVMWRNKWPIKPEVLFDGGNIATNNAGDFFDHPELSRLTTHRAFWIRYFSFIWGSSSAAAQAAWMAAQLYVEYPNIWPETIKGLIVHSARWTDKMKAQFCSDDKKKSGRRRLLRACGYGIPNLDRAIQCTQNTVNMIIQEEIQPFNNKRMNDMHLHTLPWPTDILRELNDVDVEMRVTLSYFIEPGPGEIGWKDKYRYASAGLRFDVKNTNETLEDFQKRINKKMREGKDDKGSGTSGTERWYLGSENRDVGSIHSDIWQGTAIDLCDAKYIAVYPVIGWWKERAYLGKSNEKMRYSLIVTISTPKIDADLYTEILSQIPTSVTTQW